MRQTKKKKRNITQLKKKKDRNVGPRVAANGMKIQKNLSQKDE